MPSGSTAATIFTVRSIEAGDRAALAAAFARLSPESRMQRFLTPKPYLSVRELTYLTDIDHVTDEALAALDAEGQIIAVARYARGPGAGCEAAEVAVAVVDAWQRRGIGSALTRRIVSRARDNGFASLTASTFWENAPARALLARLGFRPVGSSDGIVEYRLALPAIRPCAA
jgi:RimJ/RimL family protein N-acetyltransferase